METEDKMEELHYNILRPNFKLC